MAGGSVLSRIQIIMEANTARYNNEMRRARENSNTTFSEISKNAGKAAMVAGAAIAGMGALSIKTAMSFETAMAEIDKTVDFASSNGLANMRKELQALTTQIPQTFEELAAVTATGGQLGIAEKDLVRFTEVMAKMGVAFDIPAQQAADSMAKIANVFQIPIANIDKLGDAINTLSNNTPATAAQLIDALQRVGGVAKVFGLSADATLGLTGALIAMGKPAEVASTAVNSMLTSFSTLEYATKSQRIGFEQLGLDIDDFSKLVATDGKQAITTYLEAINNLEESKRIGTNALIIGKEFGDDITMLAGSVSVLENNWAMLGETANTTKDYFGSMDVEFKKISDTSANKLVLFKNNIDGVAASLGDAFIPALNDLLLNMTPVVASIGTWVAANPELIQQVTVIGGALIGTAAGLKLAVDGFTAAKTTFDGLKLAYAALGTTMGLTVIAIGALLLVGALVYQNWDKIKQVVKDNEPVFIVLAGVIGSVTAALIAVYAPMFLMTAQAWLAAAGATAMTAATTIWTGVSTIAAGVTWAFGAAVAFLTSPIGLAVVAVGLLVAAGVYLYKNWDTVKAKAIEIWGSISKWVSDKAQAAKMALSGAWNAAKIDTVNAFNSIKTSIITALQSLPSRLLQFGKDIVSGLINGIKSGVSNVANAMSNMASSAVSAAKKALGINSPSKVMRKIGDSGIAGGLAQGIKKGSKVVVSEAERMAEDATRAVRDIALSLTKEIELFDDDSRLASFNFDVSAGKYDGAPQLDIDNVRNLYKFADVRALEKEALKEMAKYQREAYEATLIYNNELDRVAFELDHVLGKYKDLKPELKEFLRDEAKRIDNMRLQQKAMQVIAAYDKQIALAGDNSNYASIAYDLNSVANEMSNLADEDKIAILEKAWQLEQVEKVSAISKEIFKDIQDAQKEIALLGSTSALDEFNYDLQYTQKYAYATADEIESLRAALVDLDLAKAQASSQTAFDDLLGDLRGGTEIDKLNEQYRDKLIIIEKFEAAHTDLVEDALEARRLLNEEYAKTTRDLMIGSSTDILGSMTDSFKTMLGEQNKFYKIMFAAQQSFVMVSAGLNMYDAWGDAMAKGATIAQKFAAAATITAEFGKIISAASSMTLELPGYRTGGFTAAGRDSDTVGLVHANEFVANAPTTRKYRPELEAMHNGTYERATNTGNNINVNVSVTMDGNSSVESNSAYGKQIGQGLAAVIVSEVNKMMRPNGALDRQYARR